MPAEPLRAPVHVGQAPPEFQPESQAAYIRRMMKLAEDSIAEETIDRFGEDVVNACLAFARTLPEAEQREYQRRLFKSPDEAARVVTELHARANPQEPAQPAASLAELQTLLDRAQSGDPEALRRIAATPQAAIDRWADGSDKPSPHVPVREESKPGEFALRPAVYQPAKSLDEWKRIYADAERGDPHAMERLKVSDPGSLEPAAAPAPRPRSSPIEGDSILKSPFDLASGPDLVRPPGPAAPTAAAPAVLLPPRLVSEAG